MISFNNVNRVALVGRLFREPEFRTFGNGGKVAKLKMVVNNRAKSRDTGEWEDRPVFLDVEVYNRGDFGKDADHCERRLHNKDLVYVEGRLEMDQWEKDGQKQSKIKVVAESVVFLDTTPKEGSDDRPQQQRQSPPQKQQWREEYPEPSYDDGDMPFAWLVPVLLGLSSFGSVIA